MRAEKGDFIGFTFNGVHSSELGIIRTSDGSRYNENLFPTIQDKTAQIPGGDGAYFFGSNYGSRPISFPIAFDCVSESQLRRIKQLFGDKKVHRLIYDELPYKYYLVKSTGTPSLKYVCFDRGEFRFDRDYDERKVIETKEQLYEIGAPPPFGRVYKGEGQLTFTAFSSYARSRFKYIDQYTLENIPEWGSMDTVSASDVHHNAYDWAHSANLTFSDAADEGQVVDVVTSSGVMYYNPGDLPAHFNLDLSWSGTFPGVTFMDSVSEKRMELDSFNFFGEDNGIRINTRLNLIEGLINGEPSGNLYNEFILNEDFFPLPVTEVVIASNFLSFNFTGGNPPTNFSGTIEYDYLYY